MSAFAHSNISVVNNVFIKQMNFVYKGMTAVTHAHVYDHQTLLASGSLRLIIEGDATDYTAPAVLLIEAGKHHGMIALEDGTVAYCIHAMKDDEPLVRGIPNEALTQLV